MATIGYTAEPIGPSALRVSWTPLTQTSTDDGTPYEAHPYSDRSVQVLGTFGTGGTLVIEGSNVPVPSAPADWRTLTDPQGNALSFTAANLEAIAEYVRHIRPRVTGGDGTTSLTVHMVMRA